MLLNYKVTPRRLEITSASSSATYGTRQPQVQFGMPVLLGMTRNAGCGRHAPQRNCQWAPSARPQRPQLALPVGYSSPRAWGLAALRCEARGVHPNTRLVPTVQLPTAVSIEESLRWATGIGTTSATGQRKSGRSSLASSISLD